jgi:DNA phosphorothioation-dependent restriction protein DptG
LAYGEYPLARPLYYILKENSAGSERAFMNFMSLERGQLIFRDHFWHLQKWLSTPGREILKMQINTIIIKTEK